MEFPRIAKTLAPFALLAFAEILIFFHDPEHFFIADTLTWMEYRYRSFGEFLSGFAQVDPGLWYRPLAQRTVPSLLFPVFGLNPLPYRIIGFVLFFLCTIGVYLLAERLTGSRRIAWFTVLVFTPHLIHTFPTYDAAFTPELVFTLFYIGSALFYVQYLRTHKRAALIASAALFVGGLLSKESAVAVPFTLLAIWFILPREKRGTAWSVAPHFAILGLYLLLAVGYLHIRQQNLEDLLRGTGPSSPEYAFGAGRHVLDNLDMSFSWAFGMPHGIHGQWKFDSPEMRMGLKVLRTLAIAGAICVLLTPRRRFLLLGIAWFLTAALPGVPLVSHFLPYYLFAALIGFALAMGTILDWAYAQSRKVLPHAAIALPVAWLAVWTFVHASTGRWIATNDEMLGSAARVSGTTVNGIRALYPNLPKGTHVVFFNEDVPLAARDQAGVLLQLAYNDPSLTMHYVTIGVSIPPEDLEMDKVLAFKWVDGRIVDITAFIRQRPELLVPHAASTKA